jgi:hypothetical protein
MPAYGQKQLAYNARNANSVVMTIGDTVVAFAQTASHSFGFGTQALYGIGSALPQEIQQLQIGPSISIDAIALTDAGIQMLAGGNNIATILGNNQFDLHVSDGIAVEVLFTYVGAVASDFAESIPANRPVTQTISFIAMDVLDKTGNSILNTSSAFTVTNALSAAGSAATLGAAAL